MYNTITNFIKELYSSNEFIPLHAPCFLGKEKEYLAECIDSTFVSYVGKFVTQFENQTTKYTGAKYAIAVTNGTVALQIALKLAGVKPGDEVITQALTFVATANAISHCNGTPVFIDVEKDTMGMSPQKLEDFLSENTIRKPDGVYNKISNKKISAICPMHTFGHPVRITEIMEISERYNIPVVEDSAESLGSFYKNKHTGTFGLAGVLSYNGNKTITCGGGGMIITDDEEFATQARHITTTAKKKHPYEFIHDSIAFNFRMPNVNAAVGVGQMELIDEYLKNKKETSKLYNDFFSNLDIDFFIEPNNSTSNYWLNSIVFNNKLQRDKFLEYSNSHNVMTRPIWRLLNKLDIYKNCISGDLSNSEWFEERVVNIPSGYRS